MAWDLSADREREQMESLRNAWLEREEVILNHFRVSAAMFRWGYRILGIIGRTGGGHHVGRGAD